MTLQRLLLAVKLRFSKRKKVTSSQIQAAEVKALRSVLGCTRLDPRHTEVKYMFNA
jgi:hypothetical protein